MRGLTLPIVLGVAVVAGCHPADRIDEYTIAAFGTQMRVQIRGTDVATANAAVAAVDREMQQLHRRWHAWEPGLLVDINHAISEGRRIELPRRVIAAIEHARGLERASGGRFNPAIGRLLALWGFHASELPEGPPPAESDIERLVEANPSMADLVIEDGTLASTNPAVQLDFGAYIKGVAVDRALTILADAGVPDAIVNAGGDLGVIGTRGKRPWRAAVRHPDADDGRLLARLEVFDGERVFTSGNYLRYRSDEGIRYGHIIDPRDGLPADHVASVTVVHDNGAEADAAATALAVAAPGEWPAVAAAMGIDKVMRVDASGTVRLTPRMRERTRFDHAPPRVETVSVTGR